MTAKPTPFQITTPCRVCGKGVSELEAKRTNSDAYRGTIHEKCLVNECVARDALIQQLNNGQVADVGQRCAECQKSLDEIERLTGKRSLFLSYRSEAMVLLCRECSDKAHQKDSNNTAWTRFKYLSREEFYKRALKFFNELKVRW